MSTVAQRQSDQPKSRSIFHLLPFLFKFFRYLDPTRDLPSFSMLPPAVLESGSSLEPGLTSCPTKAPIQALFLSVDGTLLDEKHPDLSQSTFNALRSLQKRGVRVALSTSRNLASILTIPKLAEFLFDGYILAGGSEIYDRKRRMLEYQGYVPADLKVIFDECQARKIPVFFHTGKPNLTLWTEESRAFARSHHFLPVEIKPWKGEDVSMLTIISTDVDLVRSILDLAPGMNWVSSAANQQDLYPEGVNKANAIEKMLAYWNLEGACYAAFGKNQADKSMFEQAALSIAMPHSHKSLRHKADFVCEDHQENTIACALKDLDLLDGSLCQIPTTDH